MYFDAVVDVMMMPVYNGTRAEVLEWLKTNEDVIDVLDVCIGKTLEVVSASEYVNRFG
jgi:hypothetical protein